MIVWKPWIRSLFNLDEPKETPAQAARRELYDKLKAMLSNPDDWVLAGHILQNRTTKMTAEIAFNLTTWAPVISVGDAEFKLETKKEKREMKELILTLKHQIEERMATKQMKDSLARIDKDHAAAIENGKVRCTRCQKDVTTSPHKYVVCTPCFSAINDIVGQAQLATRVLYDINQKSNRELADMLSRDITDPKKRELIFRMIVQMRPVQKVDGEFVVIEKKDIQYIEKLKALL